MATRTSSLNRPDPLTKVVLGLDETKTQVEYDAAMPDCVNMYINKEDHTIGNLLAKDPDVKFSAYCITHPLENKMHLKVQTISKTSPLQSINNSLKALEESFMIFQSQLRMQ